MKNRDKNSSRDEKRQSLIKVLKANGWKNKGVLMATVKGSMNYLKKQAAGERSECLPESLIEEAFENSQKNTLLLKEVHVSLLKVKK